MWFLPSKHLILNLVASICHFQGAQDYDKVIARTKQKIGHYGQLIKGDIFTDGAMNWMWCCGPEYVEGKVKFIVGNPKNIADCSFKFLTPEEFRQLVCPHQEILLDHWDGMPSYIDDLTIRLINHQNENPK